MASRTPTSVIRKRRVRECFSPLYETVPDECRVEGDGEEFAHTWKPLIELVECLLRDATLLAEVGLTPGLVEHQAVDAEPGRVKLLRVRALKQRPRGDDEGVLREEADELTHR